MRAGRLGIGWARPAGKLAIRCLGNRKRSVQCSGTQVYQTCVGELAGWWDGAKYVAHKAARRLQAKM